MSWEWITTAIAEIAPWGLGTGGIGAVAWAWRLQNRVSTLEIQLERMNDMLLQIYIRVVSPEQKR